ncbi:Gfo/Idh/MocA family oxidoreductase [Brachybacterium sp. AOP35-5H-19]|uniref:Gfo/Idh/MocA family oxidoreductase n=1 Tax=Brachybacterium sp. AOP35-5H-19 TaxID=3457685 RepID=UPI0040345F7E
MPKTLNIAVIGAGTMAQAVHLPVLRRRWDRFTIAALVDHSPRRRRESSEVWGIEEDKRYETVADLIAAVRAKSLAIDAALLSTDGLHVEDLLTLMRRGIPVLVEPPVGFSADEVEQVAGFERMTGRRLLMMAYPQQYDDSVTRMSEHIPVKDLRMVDHEVLMPASQPLFGSAHVTTASYDLPTEVRSQRRKALQAAVEAGAGAGATQRDRDLYVKGLLTGVAHQMAVIEAAYGPIARLVAVRHWPKGVIPGSIELLGELDGGAQVRLVWHYLPFAPEYSESVQVLSARRRMRVELPAPSHSDVRSTISLREKKSGVVQETSTTAPKGAVELMWEAFHAFVEKGKQPVSGAAEAAAQVTLLREVLSSIVGADGRSLEAEKDAADDEAHDAAPGDEVLGDEAVEGEAREDEAPEPAAVGGATAQGEPELIVEIAEPAAEAPGTAAATATATATAADDDATATADDDPAATDDAALAADATAAAPESAEPLGDAQGEEVVDVWHLSGETPADGAAGSVAPEAPAPNGPAADGPEVDAPAADGTEAGAHATGDPAAGDPAVDGPTLAAPAPEDPRS